MNKIVAKRLKELRKELELSTMQVAKAIGVSDATISRWENNLADIKSEEIYKLAKFFAVSSDYLIGLED